MYVRFYVKNIYVWLYINKIQLDNNIQSCQFIKMGCCIANVNDSNNVKKGLLYPFVILSFTQYNKVTELWTRFSLVSRINIEC